jgi:hypothetical protein
LPFWVIHCSTGKRERLGVSGVAGQQVELWADGQRILQLQGSISGESLQDLLLQGIQIVPRGALITTFLRLLCSDLFVHGTGGGKYDRFTDELIRSWWKVQPPLFCVDSRCRMPGLRIVPDVKSGHKFSRSRSRSGQQSQLSFSRE